MVVFLVLSLLVFVFRRLRARFFPTKFVDASGKHVFVTGCDTGFGNMLAKQLDGKGYTVFAGCLTEAGMKELKAQCSDRVVPLKIDVTKEDDIAAAVKLVKERTDTLHALVNNAGIAQGSLIDWTPMSTFRRVMEVNCFGGIALTKSFLPLLLKRGADGKKGRVVNITSLAGMLAGPGLGAYSCSKFAFEAFSDTLRREMRDWGLTVCLVEPGFMKTPIVHGLGDAMTKMWAEVPQETKQRWGEDFYQQITGAFESIESESDDPQKVIVDLLDAIGSTQPKTRYQPGMQSQIVAPLMALPTSVVDFIVRNMPKKGKAVTVLPAALRDEKKL